MFMLLFARIHFYILSPITVMLIFLRSLLTKWMVRSAPSTQNFLLSLNISCLKNWRDGLCIRLSRWVSHSWIKYWALLLVWTNSTNWSSKHFPVINYLFSCRIKISLTFKWRVGKYLLMATHSIINTASIMASATSRPSLEAKPLRDRVPLFTDDEDEILPSLRFLDNLSGTVSVIISSGAPVSDYLNSCFYCLLRLPIFLCLYSYLWYRRRSFFEIQPLLMHRLTTALASSNCVR